MEIFVLQHQTNFRSSNVGVYEDLNLAIEALDRKLHSMISESMIDTSIKRKTPDNTQPWHWPKVVYAVDLNQFTAEAGDVPDWFVIEKYELVTAQNRESQQLLF
jgi:hypothetical protein